MIKLKLSSTTTSRAHLLNMDQSHLIACFNFARKRKFLLVLESDSNQSQGQTQAFWQFYANRKKAVLPPPTHTHKCITHANSHTHTHSPFGGVAVWGKLFIFWPCSKVFVRFRGFSSSFVFITRWTFAQRFVQLQLHPEFSRENLSERLLANYESAAVPLWGLNCDEIWIRSRSFDQELFRHFDNR